VKKRRRLIVVLIVCAGLVLGVVLRWIGSSDQAGSEAQPAVTVRVGTARVGSIERVLSTSGTLSAGATIYLTSKISGRIDSILVREGQEVTEGELLIRIEEDTPRLQLEQAYAVWQAARARYDQALQGVRSEELENARALYEKAKRDLVTSEDRFTRSQQLFESGAIAKAQFEQAETELRGARTELGNAGRSLKMLEEGAGPEEKRMALAQAEAARANYELARLQLDFTRIQAPASGVIARILQDEGNVVGTTTPILVLFRDESMKVEIRAAEKYYGEISGAEQALQTRVYPLAYPDSPAFAGRILTVAPTVDPDSRTFNLTVDIEDPQGRLRPGMYAEVELVLQHELEALLLPRSAVVDREGRSIVFVVERTEEGAVAAERPVVSGLSNAREVQILSGIEAQQRVIVEGNTFLENGQRIEVSEGQ